MLEDDKSQTKNQSKTDNYLKLYCLSGALKKKVTNMNFFRFYKRISWLFVICTHLISVSTRRHGCLMETSFEDEDA